MTKEERHLKQEEVNSIKEEIKKLLKDSHSLKIFANQIGERLSKIRNGILDGLNIPSPRFYDTNVSNEEVEEAYRKTIKCIQEEDND